MSEVVASQTPFLYLAQFVLGLGIGIMLSHFSRVYSRIYLRTWSYSAYTFCTHVILFAYLTSPYSTDPFIRTACGLVSSIFNNIHIALMFIGIAEAIRRKAVKKTPRRTLIAVAIGIGAITAAAFAINPKDFIYEIGSVAFITGVSFVTGGVLLLVPASLRGIGVKIVGGCFIAYGVIYLYDVNAVILTLRGEEFLLPETGLIKLVLIALIGLGLMIWLLEDEQAELRKTNKELDSFIYSTSHDLRAPVASVLGLVNVARIDTRDAKSLEFLNLIEGRIQKLDHVITDILNLSRVKKTELRYENVDFNALLADSMADVKFLEGSRQIEIRYFESPGNRFIGDYSLTKMVLGNLLSNAVKYHSPTKADPYIEVQFEKADGQVSFVVADNGEGIDAEHHKKIFDMFYRASEKSQGTGLGLYIVKETLARIGGSVVVKSRRGTGTTFKVTLEQPA
jgi:signal transduction histidine kinase